MKKISYFYNNGPLDPRAFTIMGMSAKSNQESIGQFGTGLKYAISGILREGGKIKIFTEGETFEFTTEKEEFRGKKFSSILCNGEKLAYTTDYGVHWQPWQWFRELHSNALDENGNSDTKRPNDHYDTVIEVEHSEIANYVENKDKYFNKEIPIVETKHGNFFAKGNKVYCKTVYVGESQFPFSFESSSISLTEDRTAERYSVSSHITRAALACDNLEIIREILSENCQEFSQYAVYSQKISETALNEIERKYYNKEYIHQSLLVAYEEVRGKFKLPKWKPSSHDNRKLEKVLTLLANGGYKITEKINFVESENGEQILFGYAQDGEIFLTPNAFESIRTLALTVLEEHAHCQTGFKDFTRDFQDWLFDQIMDFIELI